MANVAELHFRRPFRQPVSPAPRLAVGPESGDSALPLGRVSSFVLGHVGLMDVVGSHLLELTREPEVTAALIVENLLPGLGAVAVPIAHAADGALVPIDAVPPLLSLDASPSADASDAEDEWARVLPSGSGQRRHRVLTVAGSFWGAITLGLAAPPSPRTLAAVDVLADIVAALMALRGRLEEAEEEANLSRAVLEAQSDLVVRLDARGRVRYVNPAFCHAVGVPVGLALGNSLSLVSPALAWLEQGIGERREREVVDALMRGQQGLAGIRVQWVVTPVLGPEGRVGAVQAVGRPSSRGASTSR